MKNVNTAANGNQVDAKIFWRPVVDIPTERITVRRVRRAKQTRDYTARLIESRIQRPDLAVKEYERAFEALHARGAIDGKTSLEVFDLCGVPKRTSRHAQNGVNAVLPLLQKYYRRARLTRGDARPRGWVLDDRADTADCTLADYLRGRYGDEVHDYVAVMAMWRLVQIEKFGHVTKTRVPGALYLLTQFRKGSPHRGIAQDFSQLVKIIRAHLCKARDLYPEDDLEALLCAAKAVIETSLGWVEVSRPSKFIDYGFDIRSCLYGARTGRKHFEVLS